MSNATFLIAGSNNAGFCGDSRWMQPGAGQIFYTLDTNAFQQAYDSFPGWPTTPTISTGGSIWSRLGHILAAQPTPLWESVCYAPIPANGPLATWGPIAINFSRLIWARGNLSSAGRSLTAIIWLQGETDALCDAADGMYYDNVISMVDGLRFNGISCPVFVAVCTECKLYGPSPGTPAGADFQLIPQPSERLNRWRWQERVQAEQRALQLRSDKGIFAGANTDAIRGRYDGCHLNSIGQYAAALRWFEIITSAKMNGVI